MEKGLKLKEDKFRSDIKKKFFPVRVVMPWHRLPHPWKHSMPGWMGP